MDSGGQKTTLFGVIGGREREGWKRGMGMGRREERLKSDGGNGLCNYIIFRIPTGRKSRLIKAVGNSVPHYLFLRGEARAQSLTFPFALRRRGERKAQTGLGADESGRRRRRRVARYIPWAGGRSPPYPVVNGSPHQSPYLAHKEQKRGEAQETPLLRGSGRGWARSKV